MFHSMKSLLSKVCFSKPGREYSFYENHVITRLKRVESLGDQDTLTNLREISRNSEKLQGILRDAQQGSLKVLLRVY